MPYALLADLVMLLHFGFILFAVLGALLVARWPRLIWLHVPAALWAMWIVIVGGICPLTPLEQRLRRLAGDEAYSGGFIEYYIGSLIYPAGLTPTIGILLGLAVLLINAGLYTWIYRRRHRPPPSSV